VTYKTDLFLVWSTEHAAGIVVPEDDVKSDLSKGAGYPPYVLFRIGEETFRCEIGASYPFRFYPEMNQPAMKCGHP
jgi:hypothetical protein